MLGLNTHNRSITVSRTKLLESLRSNQIKHSTEYALAMQDYHKAITIELKKALKTVGSVTDDLESLRKVKIDFDVPVSHDDDYSNVIQMLEYSSADAIEIDEAAFQAYINNKWPWQRSFHENATKYLAASGRAG